MRRPILVFVLGTLFGSFIGELCYGFTLWIDRIVALVHIGAISGFSFVAGVVWKRGNKMGSLYGFLLTLLLLVNMGCVTIRIPHDDELQRSGTIASEKNRYAPKPYPPF